MMKIAHVVWGMKTGGVETMLVNIINEHVKSAEVRLFIVNDFVDEFVIEKLSPLCKIFRLNRKPKDRSFLKILKLNWWLWRYKPDIIHVHSNRVSKLIFGNWNIVRTIHGMWNNPEEYPRMKKLYSISNVVGEKTKGQGFESTVIENGIKVREMKCKVTTPCPPSVFKLVQVGRLWIKHKGQDILLKALKNLIDNGITNFRMYFIGTGGSEGYLKQLTIDLSLEKYVVFEGVKSQEYIYEHLHEYDVFIQPSRQEGFGLTVAEAKAAKLPVLVSDINGPMEVIDYGKYGMHFRNGNVVDLANKLETILKGGYDYKMIEPAFEYVKSHYDISISAKKYFDEYKKLL